MRGGALPAWMMSGQGRVSAIERVRASVGALIGLLLTGFVSRTALGPDASLPMLIAPMGASAVLLFAVPSSPLAQPWSVLGGNLISALIGVTAAKLIADPVAAASVGGALAIGCMMVLRCLHPPSGAVALTAILGGPAIHAAGYGFVIWPTGLNSVLLLAVALVFNNATGRTYPHNAGVATNRRSKVAKAVLRRHDAMIDVDPADLASLADEMDRESPRSAALATCGSVMTPEPDALVSTASVDVALALMERSRRGALPVVDAEGRCIGIVSEIGLLRHLRPTPAGRKLARLFRRSLHVNLVPATLSQAMRSPTVTATEGMPLAAVLPAILAADIPYCPVLDADGRVLGAITPSDLLRRLAAAPDAAGQPRSPIQRL